MAKRQSYPVLEPPSVIQVHGDLSPNNRFIDVKFAYDPQLVSYIRKIPDAHFIGSVSKGGPLWRLPLEMSTAKALRHIFGNAFVPSAEMKKWGMRRNEVAAALKELVSVEYADLPECRELVQDLYEALFLGPRGKDMTPAERKAGLAQPVEAGSYQTGDVAFMTHNPHPANANQPGLGKTLEAIGAVVEGNFFGGKLVIAPKTSLEVVWGTELAAWQFDDVILCYGSKNRRQLAIEAALEYQREGRGFWFVTNPANVQYQAVWEVDDFGEKTGKKKLWLKHPELHELEWDVVILDEGSSWGLGNPNSLTSRGVNDLKRKKGMCLDGTPIRGKPIKLFGPLHFLDPERHSSKGKWGDHWLASRNDGYGKVYGDVKKELEPEFWEMIGEYFVRRTKAEVAKWLPPKQHVDRWAVMEGRQKAIYERMAEEAEVRIDELRLSAVGILAEYLRLKQIAFSYPRIEGRKEPPGYTVFPTLDSCKLPIVEELLRERGILGGDDNEAGEEVDTDAQVVIFSQFSTVVDLMVEWLASKGVRVAKITGAVSSDKRTKLTQQFQSKDGDRPQVMVMNSKAAGVAITLDNADTVIHMDEWWDPDTQEQAEDRVHRVSRIHQVTVYTIRTKGSIEERIWLKVGDKADINKRIMDLRREGLRAT